MPEFKPKTVYVIYIASTPEKIWEALTSPEFTRKYFWDLGIELEPKLGGEFALQEIDVTRGGRRVLCARVFRGKRSVVPRYRSSRRRLRGGP